MSRKDRDKFEPIERALRESAMDVRVNSTLQQRICAWLEANSVDPNHIPVEAGMTFTGDQLTTTVYRLNADGRHFIDPDRVNALATEVATYTISVPPPPDVAAWLAGRQAP